MTKKKKSSYQKEVLSCNLSVGGGFKVVSCFDAGRVVSQT